MIYKTLARHSTGSYGSLISYITKEGKGKNNGPVHVFTHNFRGGTPKEWIHEFKINESYRKHPRADQVLLRHSILSLSPDEDPQYATREVMEDLARKYIQLRGEDGMYIVGIHEEGAAHLHCHIAESGLKLYTGMAHRMTKDDMHRIKVELQQYQKDKYPELSFSIADHGKGAEYLRDAEWHLKKRNERTLSKETIRAKVAELYGQSKTQKKFLELLRDNNLHHYERNGMVQGLVDENGLKFRFSRLDVAFDELPVDVIEKTEEQQILEEIQVLRAARGVKEREYEIERDEMDFTRYVHVNSSSLFE